MDDSTVSADSFTIDERVTCRRFTGLPRNFSGTVVKVYDHALLLKLDVHDFANRYQATLDELNNKIVMPKRLVVLNESV